MSFSWKIVVSSNKTTSQDNKVDEDMLCCASLFSQLLPSFQQAKILGFDFTLALTERVPYGMNYPAVSSGISIKAIKALRSGE